MAGFLIEISKSGIVYCFGTLGVQKFRQNRSISNSYGDRSNYVFCHLIFGLKMAFTGFRIEGQGKIWTWCRHPSYAPLTKCESSKWNSLQVINPQKWFLCQKCHQGLSFKTSPDLEKKRLKATIWHAYRGHLYAFCIWNLGSSTLPYLRSGPKCAQKTIFWHLSGLHWPICWRPLPQNDGLRVLPHK